MFERSKTISAWQTGILLFVLLLANKVLLLPSLVESRSRIEPIVVVSILFLFEIGLLILFYNVKKKFPNESFFDLIGQKFGKILTIMLAVIIFFYFFCKAVFLYNVVCAFLRNLVYKDVSGFLFLIAILPVVNFLAFSGLTAHARTMQIFFPFIFLIILFCIIVGSFRIDGDIILYPMQTLGVFQNMIKFVGLFGDTLFLFVVMDKINVKRGQWKVVFSLAGTGMALALAVTVVFVLSFTYTSFLHPFALFELLSFVKEYEGLGRIDILPVIVIMFLSFYQLALYFCAMTTSVERVFQKVDKTHALAIIDTLFVLVVSCLVTGLSKTIWLGVTLSPYLAGFSFVVIPLVAIVLCLRRRV